MSRRIIAQLEAQTRRHFRDAAALIPADIADQLKARAKEGVNSGEPHKATGGWVASPFYGSGHDIIGLLEIASQAVQAAQAEHNRESSAAFWQSIKQTSVT